MMLFRLQTLTAEVGLASFPLDQRRARSDETPLHSSSQTVANNVRAGTSTESVLGTKEQADDSPNKTEAAKRQAA
jgi:hypothetical protein